MLTLLMSSDRVRVRVRVRERGPLRLAGATLTDHEPSSDRLAQRHSVNLVLRPRARTRTRLGSSRGLATLVAIEELQPQQQPLERRLKEQRSERTQCEERSERNSIPRRFPILLFVDIIF